jgi:hypothetical protein
MFGTFLGKLAQNPIGLVKNNIPIIHKIGRGNPLWLPKVRKKNKELININYDN